MFFNEWMFSFYGQKNKRTCFFNEWMFSFYGQKNRRTCFLTSGCFLFMDRRTKEHIFLTSGCFLFMDRRTEEHVFQRVDVFFLWTEEQKNMFFNEWMFFFCSFVLLFFCPEFKIYILFLYSRNFLLISIRSPPKLISNPWSLRVAVR